MRNTLSLSLVVGSLVWCTSGWCEEKQLDPGVINGWVRSVETSGSPLGKEIKRVVHSTTMQDWTSDSDSNHVRYEVGTDDCKKTLTFSTTELLGDSYFESWVELIKADQKRNQKQLEKPRIFVRPYRSGGLVGDFPIMDLNVEYQVQDGIPVIVASDQLDVLRTVREFKKGTAATVRVTAFDTQYTFRMNLDGFTDKAEWSEVHCPDEDVEENRSDKDSVLSPASS